MKLLLQALAVLLFMVGFIASWVWQMMDIDKPGLPGDFPPKLIFGVFVSMGAFILLMNWINTNF